jgi:hypothetical protein
MVRSGTSQFHGFAWEFHRNDSLNAVGFFKPVGGQKPVLIRNQFGFTLGGPIRRDQSFFFANYKGFRQIQRTLRFASIPTALAGREWRPKGDPETARVHDFMIRELGRATPHRILGLVYK